MASAESVLLQSTLEIHNKPYSVKLTSSEIYWETISSKHAAGGPYSEPLVKTESQTVKLSEIIAVKLGGRQAEYEGPSKFCSLEMVSLSPTQFVIWVVRRCQHHKWRERKIIFCSKDTSVVQQWVDKIQQILNRPDAGRPKSLLVFINPVAGRRQAPKVYRDKVAPLLELAGITVDVVTTQRQNHARDLLMDYDLSKIDGVLSVGGDGMFTEIVHGLLNRALKDTTGDAHPTPSTPLPKTPVRVGIISTGSTDTVCYTTTGTNDPITSTLHTILGDSVAMDVATVFHGNQFTKYNMSLMGYGYYGDCMAGSEQNRWMGPKRYDWEGLKKVLGLRVYEGEISYVPSKDRESTPRDGTTCKAGCAVCQAVSADATEQPPVTTEGDQDVVRLRGRFVAINSFLISCRCRFSPEGPAPAAHLGDGCADLVIIRACSRIDYVRHLYRCTKASLDQYDFEFMSVVRIKSFKFRLLSDEGDTKVSQKDEFGFDFLHTARVSEYQFRPLVDEIDDTVDGGDNKMASQQRLRSRDGHNSVWNCDGEVVEEPSVDYRVHRQVIRLFALGVEDEVKGQSSLCSCIK